MTTMNDATTRAARLLGVVRAGQVPTGQDANDIRAYIQGAINGLPGLRNGSWVDVILTSADDYEASDGERIDVNGFDPIITLPTTRTDDCGNTVIQRDLSRVHVVGDGLYVWSASLGAWNKTDELDGGDPFPFGDEDLPGIVALAVMEAADEYGAEVSTQTAQRAEASTQSLTARFWRGLSAQVDPALRIRRRYGF